MILGIDEVGRGPWAGPLVVGAVVLGDATIDGLTDSKKITKKRRTELDGIIRERVAGYGLGWVSALEIDEIGLGEALRLATRRAVEKIKVPYHEIIIDGTINLLAGTSKGEYVTTMKKADLLVPSVSAASIIAKVARDNYMANQDKVYDGYKFTSHVGYGTAMHRKAIEKHGVTPLHRLSFAPLARYRSLAQLDAKTIDPPHESANLVSTTTVGSMAEEKVANYLQGNGHEIIGRNWKTKYCEIDIISSKGRTVYFTEVKYRKKSDRGDGLVAITPKKQKQMTFAAKVYIQAKRMHDLDVQLAVASVSGDTMVVEEWLALA